MRVFIAVLVLIFSFQSWTKADDISEFEIEGMSIGDSLLVFFTKEEIKNNTKNYYDNRPNFKYVAIDIENHKSLEQYFGVQIHVKKNDSQYIMHGISGYLYYKDNIEDCYSKMNDVEKEFDSMFKNLKKKKVTFDHPADPTGNSKVTAIYFYFSNKDTVSINCYDWSEEKLFSDNFDISLDTKEFYKAASEL